MPGFSRWRYSLQIGDRAAVFVVLVPSSTGFLAVAAHLAEIIPGKSLADAGLLQVAIFLADSPADIESCEIANRERTHGHAEIIHRGIDGFDTRAFFQKKNGLADIRMKHAVADKAAAVPYEDADLADFLRELHAAGNDFFVAGFAANDFEEAHHVGRAEEMRADHGLRTCGRGSNLVDVERGRVASEDGARLADAIEFSEDFFLERHAFEDGFNHQIGIRKRIVTERRLNQLEPLVNKVLRETAALH